MLGLPLSSGAGAMARLAYAGPVRGEPTCCHALLFQDYGLEINPNLDMNFIMMPLAGSLIDTAMNADTDVRFVSVPLRSLSFAHQTICLLVSPPCVHCAPKHTCVRSNR